jgi:hypothetical protein
MVGSGHDGGVRDREPLCLIVVASGFVRGRVGFGLVVSLAAAENLIFALTKTLEGKEAQRRPKYERG